MKDLIVVSGITRRNGMIDEYQEQLRDAKIEFHLEPIIEDQMTGTAQRKFESVYRMATSFSSYSRLVMTDAWDVLFFGTMEEVLVKLPPEPMIGMERNCWPEVLPIPSQTRWAFANGGLMSGSPDKLIEWCEWALKQPELCTLDQQWYNRHLVRGDLGLLTDTHTNIFYNYSFDREGDELQAVDGRPWNSVYGTWPNWIHFPGPCDPAPFKAMLRGEIPNL